MLHDTNDEDRRDRVCRAGEEAFDRLQKDQSWSDYTAMGEAFLAGRDEGLYKSGTNNINDPRFKKAFGAWLDRYPKLAKFDRSDRAKLFTVMENRGPIESWRSTLALNQRLKLNHPTTVLRKWQAATQMPKSGEPKNSPMAKLKQRVGELEQQVAHAEERLATSEAGSLFDLKRDSAKDIATTIIWTISATKAKSIATAVLELLKKPKPGG